MGRKRKKLEIEDDSITLEFELETELCELEEKLNDASEYVEIPTPVCEPKPLVKLAVFSAIFGPKWDQMAGFKYYATKHRLGPMSVEDWRKSYTDFMNRPTT